MTITRKEAAMNRETYEKAIKLHQQIKELSDLITIVNSNQLTFIDHLGNCTNNCKLRQIAEAHKEQIYNGLHAEKAELEREIEEL